MPYGFWYASGPKEMDTRKPGSAFSKGDLLTLNSASSLSRLNPYAAASGTIYAIATADSSDSIDGKVTVALMHPATRWWARVAPGSALTTGEVSGVSFGADASGRYFVDASASTARVVVIEGTDKVDQSVQSKAIVQFRYAAGELNLS